MVNNLVGVLQDMDQLNEAEEMHRRALAVKVAALGADHPSTAYSRGQLGHVVMLQGDSEGDGSKAARGRAAVEEALRQLKAPPHSKPGGHPWVVKLSGFLLA